MPRAFRIKSWLFPGSCSQAVYILIVTYRRFGCLKRSLIGPKLEHLPQNMWRFGLVMLGVRLHITLHLPCLEEGIAGFADNYAASMCRGREKQSF